MRRQIVATALALAALVAATPAATSAHAASPSISPADDVFYPEGEEPEKETATVESSRPAAKQDDAPAAATEVDRESALARGSRQAADLLGYLPSLYQGKWYMPAKESIRRCIQDRESNFNYKVVGAGLYFGAYQMNAGLARGATFMMEDEVEKEMGREGLALLAALRRTTPNNWNRYWQDRAFWTIWRNGDGSGHWRGGAHSCF